jgi:hypothetical protein
MHLQLVQVPFELRHVLFQQGLMHENAFFEAWQVLLVITFQVVLVLGHQLVKCQESVVWGQVEK